MLQKMSTNEKNLALLTAKMLSTQKKTTISHQILNPRLGCTFSFFHLGFHSLDVWFIFQMEFTPYKNEQSLHGVELRENKTTKVKGI